ncbi:adenylate/guanylate cyclase domain-containing protein [Mycobacterium sp. E740]|uniref:ATP-binding protein n=1 Tax=Mycobacterium sp. E740 TaxID=1834149 RepID=UPI003511109E
MPLKALGFQRLRDIARAVEIFQVTSAGLRSEFPPLRNLESAPGNLKQPPSSFVGREAELAELRKMLTAHRLLTLTGVGGVGKTRLAVELASLSAQGFPDGAWFIELAAISDPAAVPDAVAAVFGILQQPGQTMADSIASALEGRSRLVVFDNCEHVLDAAADIIETILKASSAVKVVATSREGLGLAEEQLWPVPSLDIGSSAATLFVDRALAVAPAISLDRDPDVVTEICRRLDGIPLAIELAASRTQSMTVNEIRDRLDDRFRLLVGSKRAFERHQTLRQAVQWSYDLLDASEKSLLNRCSVFAGGFDLAAACAVSRSDDEMATLDLLHALVRKSLVAADRSTGRTRFSMLETIRRFAEAQLVAQGAGDDARTAHARHFAAQESEVLALWDSPMQRDAYSWLTTELANLRSAFRWAAEQQDLDTASAIAVCAGFLGGWFELHEPSTWAEDLLSAARDVDHSRLAQLYVIAAECYRTGRLDSAIAYADAAVAALESGRFDRMLFDIEPTALGGAYITVGASAQWLQLCRSQFARGGEINAFNRGSMVMALLTSGNIAEAKVLSIDLLAASEATDNPGAAAYALLAYGYSTRDEDPGAAYEALRRGLAIAHSSGNRMTEAYLAVNISTLAGSRGVADDALEFLTIAINNFYDSGSYSHIVSPLGVLAARLDQIGRYEGAATIVGFAATAFALATFPEINAAIAHLREVLGERTYEALTRAGASMTSAQVAHFALEEIARARVHLTNPIETQ